LVKLPAGLPKQYYAENADGSIPRLSREPQ